MNSNAQKYDESEFNLLSVSSERTFPPTPFPRKFPIYVSKNIGYTCCRERKHLTERSYDRCPMGR